MIRIPEAPEPRSVLTSPDLLERAADTHGVPVVLVDGYYSCVTYRPSGEAILWRAPVPTVEAVA